MQNHSQNRVAFLTILVIVCVVGLVGMYFKSESNMNKLQGLIADIEISAISQQAPAAAPSSPTATAPQVKSGTTTDVSIRTIGIGDLFKLKVGETVVHDTTGTKITLKKLFSEGVGLVGLESKTGQKKNVEIGPPQPCADMFGLNLEFNTITSNMLEFMINLGCSK